MDIEGFWAIVDAARDAGHVDMDARVNALRKLLMPLPASEIQSFQNHYDKLLSQSYRWDLWGAAYVINGGCSDDGFRHFRDWLISEGRSVFEAALADPESLANLPDVESPENELYGYVAGEAFKRTTGGTPERNVSTEAADPAGVPWEEDAVYDLFPKLAARYG